MNSAISVVTHSVANVAVYLPNRASLNLNRLLRVKILLRSSPKLGYSSVVYQQQHFFFFKFVSLLLIQTVLSQCRQTFFSSISGIKKSQLGVFFFRKDYLVTLNSNLADLKTSKCLQLE